MKARTSLSSHLKPYISQLLSGKNLGWRALRYISGIKLELITVIEVEIVNNNYDGDNGDLCGYIKKIYHLTLTVGWKSKKIFFKHHKRKKERKNSFYLSICRSSDDSTVKKFYTKYLPKKIER